MWAWRGAEVLRRDTSDCSSLSRQKTENNIRMYLSLLLILSVSDSLTTEINEKRTYADYLCIISLEISAEKLVTGAAAWSAVGCLIHSRVGQSFVPRSALQGVAFCLFSKMYYTWHLMHSFPEHTQVCQCIVCVQTRLQQCSGLGYMGWNYTVGSHQFTYRADILFYGVSLLQNRNKTNLFCISATSFRSFTTRRHITALRMDMMETVCLNQMWPRKGTFSPFVSN